MMTLKTVDDDPFPFNATSHLTATGNFSMSLRKFYLTSHLYTASHSFPFSRCCKLKVCSYVCLYKVMEAWAATQHLPRLGWTPAVVWIATSFALNTCISCLLPWHLYLPWLGRFELYCCSERKLFTIESSEILNMEGHCTELEGHKDVESNSDYLSSDLLGFNHSLPAIPSLHERRLSRTTIEEYKDVMSLNVTLSHRRAILCSLALEIRRQPRRRSRLVNTKGHLKFFISQSFSTNACFPF